MATRGRPKEYPEERVTTAVRIPKVLYKRAKHAALDRDVGVGLLINRALERYLENLPPVDKVLP